MLPRSSHKKILHPIILHVTGHPYRNQMTQKKKRLSRKKRLSKWISELETSTNPRCQNEILLETPVLRKSFPLTKTFKPRTKLDSSLKQLDNSAEEAKTRCQQLETTISNLQATIKYQCSLIRKPNIIDGRNNEPFL